MNPKIIKLLKDFWKFIWEDDSLLSWVVNIILAFVLVKYLIYPLLGLMLGTQYPIVAVVSNSMEHQDNLQTWIQENKEFYANYNFTEQDLNSWNFKHGFNKGDIMILFSAKKLKKGQIAVYTTGLYKQPIIHRVVDMQDNYITTKGDNVVYVQSFEKQISKENILGKAIIRIPYLGWIKIKAVDLLNWMLN